jgi:hypothetical protein
MAAAWFIKWLEQRGSAKPVAAIAAERTRAAHPDSRRGLLANHAHVHHALVSFLIVPALTRNVHDACIHHCLFYDLLQGLNAATTGPLILTIILTSLPIALYGLIQKYRLDPLPWGGDGSPASLPTWATHFWAAT